MDISSNINKTLLNVLEKHTKDKNTELEAIIWGATYSNNTITEGIIY